MPDLSTKESSTSGKDMPWYHVLAVRNTLCKSAMVKSVDTLVNLIFRWDSSENLTASGDKYQGCYTCTPYKALLYMVSDVEI